ncbi:5'-3' exoribonuclease 2-like [Daphnia pulicaria]|uniref:5'-3' exoribonuclease 2-like n=1 Tax=Daphnia pulicaria TaxID=35523 RepID=UPI001EEABAC8|nr:5'-3' exoribonuclease 2-like [Daphnia pulicaria]
MDYIRRQRAQPSHDPNTSHILCGADADLIMLGLATHELNFTGMRQEFRPNKLIPCEICNQIGHEQNDCQGVEHPKCGENDEIGHNVAAKQNYIFIRLNVLRECLERELRMPSMSIVYDFERAIDDWIFMCLFIRNDYLPHLASLEIREGAIDRLVNLYKECVYKTKGWLTDSGFVNLDRLQIILSQFGYDEDEIFQKRQMDELSISNVNSSRANSQKTKEEKVDLSGRNVVVSFDLRCANNRRQQLTPANNVLRPHCRASILKREQSM